MTVTQIIIQLAPYKEMTRDTLYKHFRALKIKPIGKARQCPQHYPDDTPKRVLKRLGFKPSKKVQRHGSNLLAA